MTENWSIEIDIIGTSLDSRPLDEWPGILRTRMRKIIRIIICQYYTANKWKMYTEEKYKRQVG